MPNYTQTKLMCLVYSIYVLVHAQKNTKMTCEKCGKSLFPGTMFETDETIQNMCTDSLEEW